MCLMSNFNLWQLGAGNPFTVRLKLRPCPEPFEDLVFGPTSYDVHAIEVRLIIIAIQVRFQPTLSWFKTACFYFAQPAVSC